VKGFQITEVVGESDEESKGQQTCFKLEWQPASPEQISALFEKTAPSTPDEGLTNGHLTNGHLTNGHLTNGHLTNGVHTNGVHPADEHALLSHTEALMPAELVDLHRLGHPPEVQLIGADNDNFVDVLSYELREISSHNVLEAQSWDTTPGATITYVIVDTHKPGTLFDLSEHRFRQVQDLVKHASNILWITRNGTERCSNPHASMISGFANTLRMENPALRLVTLDVDEENCTASELAPIISDVLQGKHFQSETDISKLDCELAYHERQWLVPRVVVNDAITSYLTECGSKAAASDVPFFHDNRPLKLGNGQPGLLDSLQWEDQEDTGMVPKPNEVIFETRAHGVNFRDLLVAVGQLGAGKDAVMAGECSGIVVAVGKDLESEFRPGDRVCSFGAQPYANYARVPGHRCLKIPGNVSFEVAATIPIVYSTVVYALLHVAQIEKNSRVLIHSATGGVGQAAVGLAHHIGAEVFVTVGSAEKKQFLIEEFGVPEDHIFSSRDASFKQGIMDLTKGEGVDMVLNSLTGEMFRESCNCLASFGHFVEIGKRDLLANSRMEMRFFLKNASFTAMDLMVIGKKKPALCKRLLNEAMQLVATGAVMPIKITTAPLSDVSTVFRQMQGGKHMGKMVLTADRDTQVKVVPSPRKDVQLDGNSSYLIIGGLGGLGRTMIRWLAQRGCKHIVTMSRTGLKSSTAQSLVKEMQANGTSLHILECDVSDAKSVKSSLDDIKASAPPIRGIIQAAMVLQDSIFEQMKHSQWRAATLPKIQGTQNLHQYFSGHDLDFFIMLSSVVAIVGNPGQAAYAAANSYLGGLARSRNAQGLTAHCIDVGVVSDAGVVSQNDDLARMLANRGYSTITVKDLLHVIEHAISNSQPCAPALAQTVMGLGTDARTLKGPKFTHWLQVCGANAVADNAPTHSKNDLRMASSPAEAEEIARAALTAQLARLLSIEVASIDASQTLASYGIDSLISVELRNWIRAEMKATVPLLELNEAGRTIGALAGMIAKRSTLTQ